MVHNDLSEIRRERIHPFWFYRSAAAARPGPPGPADSPWPWTPGPDRSDEDARLQHREHVADRRGLAEREVVVPVPDPGLARRPGNRPAVVGPDPGTLRPGRLLLGRSGADRTGLPGNRPDPRNRDPPARRRLRARAWIGYRRPGELGADRLAAALGARIRFPGRDVVVVDGGTATTVTALGRDGAVRGGADPARVGLWHSMLAARTAQLPRSIPAGRDPLSDGRRPRDWPRESGTATSGRSASSSCGSGPRRSAAAGRSSVRGPAAPRGPSGAGILSAEDPDLVLRGLWSFAESDVVSRR